MYQRAQSRQNGHYFMILLRHALVAGKHEVASFQHFVVRGAWIVHGRWAVRGC